LIYLINKQFIIRVASIVTTMIQAQIEMIQIQITLKILKMKMKSVSKIEIDLNESLMKMLLHVINDAFLTV